MKILIVSDEPLLALGLQEALSSAGHEVVGPVPSSHAALDLARFEQPTLAIVDLDHPQPEEAVQLVALLGDLLHIETLVASSDPETIRRCGSALGQLQKPFSLEDVPRSVDLAQELAAGKRPSHAQLPSSLRLPEVHH